MDRSPDLSGDELGPLTCGEAVVCLITVLFLLAWIAAVLAIGVWAAVALARWLIP